MVVGYGGSHIFLGNRLPDGAEVVRRMRKLTVAPRKIPGTYLWYRM
jgi:hypothetical protein